NSVERERGCGGARQRHLAFSLFARVALYRFGFAFVGLFSRAVKRTTVDLEFVAVERGALVFDDGQGTSFRVWLAMNSSRSASVKNRRGRFRPWPILT